MPSLPRRFRPDVMLLAAGLGTRMLPLTRERPKPLIPIAGRAVIERVVDAALAEGCTRFVVNAHHLGQQIADHARVLAERHPQARFRVSNEEVLMGTGGGVRRALPLLESDPILVMNTDAFWLPGDDTPVAGMLARYDPPGGVLLCVRPERALGFRGGHDFRLNPSGAFGAAGEPVVYCGVALLGQALFEGTPDAPFSLMLILERLLAEGTARGCLLDAEWFHVGDPAALGEAEARLLTTAPGAGP